MQHIKPFLPAIGIFVSALLVRLCYNLAVAYNYFPMYDSLGYQSIGYYLLDEHCFCIHPLITTVYRAPLWPWLIAGISLLVGRANFFDRLFLCGIGSGTCVFIFLFARDLFNRRIGLLTGLIACIYPALFLYDGWMYTESLFTFLLIAICYCVYRIQRDGGQGRGKWIICGILLALLSLTRPNGIILIALLICWTLFMVWRKRLPKRALRSLVLTTLIACGLIVPWTIRNALVSHSFVPVATGDGTVLLGAYNDQVLYEPGYVGSWENPQKTDASQVVKPFPLLTCNAVCEVQRENVSKDAALHWIKTHLNDMPRLLIYHLLNFWTPNTREADLPMYRFPGQLSSQIVLVISETFPIPIFLLALLGLLVTLRKCWPELLFAYGVVLITVGEALFYYGSSRFRSPIEPLLLLLTAGAFWWLTQKAPGTLHWHLHQQKKHGRADNADP